MILAVHGYIIQAHEDDVLFADYDPGSMDSEVEQEQQNTNRDGNHDQEPDIVDGPMEEDNDDHGDWTMPIDIDFYNDPEINRCVYKFLRAYTTGRMNRRQAVAMWDVLREFSRFDPLELKSFDTLQRKLKATMPQPEVTWKVKRIRDGKVFAGKGKSLPERRFKDKRKFETVLVWTRIPLRDLIRYHAAKHPNARFMVNGRIDYTKVAFTFTYDGIPNGKSSPDNLHVMGLQFQGCKCVYIPHVRIARRKTLKEVEQFLGPFVKEVQQLGCKILRFVADSPMRALLKCIKGHAGNYSCELCEARGRTVDKRVCYPGSEMHQQRRTHELWLERLDDLESEREHGHVVSIKGITGASPLLRVPGFDIVRDAPSDPLHRDWLGIVKSTLWKHSVGLSKAGNMSSKGRRICEEISEVYRQVRLPKEFSHRARVIDYANFKGHEWKSLVISCFPTICDVVAVEHGEPHAHIWLLYVFLVLLYNGPAWVFHDIGIDELKEMHETLYDEFEHEFGPAACTFNWHNFHHMPTLRMNARTTDMSTEVYESSYGRVQMSYHPGTRNIGKQIANNMLLRTLVHVEGQHCENKLHVEPSKEHVNVDDSIVIDDQFNFYKVIEVHGQQVTVKRFVTKRWQCDHDSTLPFHKVGVFVNDGLEDVEVVIDRAIVQGKGIVTKDNLLIAFYKDFLYS